MSAHLRPMSAHLRPELHDGAGGGDDGGRGASDSHQVPAGGGHDRMVGRHSENTNSVTKLSDQRFWEKF